MARLTGALFSLAASGTIAETLTFAKWKGIQYVRTRVIPANPKASAQRQVRGVFSTLNELWKRTPTIGRLSYIEAVTGLPLTARNKVIQENLKTLRDDGAINNYVFSVASGQALAPTTYTVNGGAGVIDLTGFVIPTPPVGYTVTQRMMAAIAEGDPTDDGGIIRTMHCIEEDDIGAAMQIAGLAAGQYWTGGWIQWTRDSDSHLFYGSFLMAGALVT